MTYPHRFLKPEYIQESQKFKYTRECGEFVVIKYATLGFIGWPSKFSSSKVMAIMKPGSLREGLRNISVEPFIILYALGDCLYFIQSQNLWIEKTCKVGSYFFGNGTTFSDEVVFL